MSVARLLSSDGLKICLDQETRKSLPGSLQGPHSREPGDPAYIILLHVELGRGLKRVQRALRDTEHMRGEAAREQHEIGNQCCLLSLHVSGSGP